MGIIGDILLFPFKGIFFIFEEIHDAAFKALREDAEQVTENLRKLHYMLEQGKITETEFDIQEAKLLDRLDQVNMQLNGTQAEQDDDDDETQDDDDDDDEEENDDKGDEDE